MAGITTTGFEIDTLQQLEQEIEDAIKSSVLGTANTAGNTVFGQLKALIAQRDLKMQELLQDVYNSKTIAATGTNLDLVAELAGKIRFQAQKARIRDFELTFSGNIDLSAGFTFAKEDDDTVLFELEEDFSYTYVGPGNETTTIDLVATETGILDVSTDEINVIVSPIANLESATNDSSSTFVQGRDIETDAELRIRLQNEPFTTQEGTAFGIRGSILALNNIEDSGITAIENVFVVENPSNSQDADGRPAHSYEVIVYYDGCIASPDSDTDEAIVEAIAKSRPVGIEAVSTTGNEYSATYTLDNNNSIGIVFSRPSTTDIYVRVDCTGENGALTSDQKTALKEWIEEWGNDLGVGQDVVVYGRESLTSRLNDFEDIALTDYEISITTTGAAPAPTPGTTDANIEINNTSISFWDTANINIQDL